MADTDSGEPVMVGSFPAPVDFVEAFVDQPVSPANFVIRIPPVGALDSGPTPPADPPETPTEGGNNA